MRFNRPSLLAILVFVTAVPVLAKPFVLTVGGGPTPTSDQLSLEQNVVYFRDVLNQLGAGAWQQQLLFADGGAGEHTVQYMVPEDDDSRFLSALDSLTTNGGDVNYRYRRTELKQILAPATADQLTKWFNTTGAKLPPGDELLFYYTGHGGQDANGTSVPRNTTLALWDKPSMTMREFASLLDKTNPAVQVMLVMVQCHSGGFANVIYKGGNPRNGLVDQLRFGFFSTTAPRMAAGCTADIRGDDYKEFSTAFFAALCGKTRAGQLVEKPDYDHDGRTSYMDAFTYVLLTSDTIDIPMTTSDQLLRDFSRFADAPQRRRGAPATAPTPPTTQSTRLLSSNASFSDIDAAATDSQRAAITGLAKILKLNPADPVAGAKLMATRVDRDRQDAIGQSQTAQRQFLDARERLRHSVYLKWPELRDPWLPTSVTLRDADHLPKLRADIEGMPEYTEFVKAHDKTEALDDKTNQLERTWIKTQRLIERANTVILQANLPLVASMEIQQRFKLLVQHENGSISGDHF